jgi:hypothetical protein
VPFAEGQSIRREMKEECHANGFVILCALYAAFFDKPGDG